MRDLTQTKKEVPAKESRDFPRTLTKAVRKRGAGDRDSGRLPQPDFGHPSSAGFGRTDVVPTQVGRSADLDPIDRRAGPAQAGQTARPAGLDRSCLVAPFSPYRLLP